MSVVILEYEAAYLRRHYSRGERPKRRHGEILSRSWNLNYSVVDEESEGRRTTSDVGRSTAIM